MTLTLEEVPWEYMDVGRAWRAYWEIKLSWQPVSYWIPREDDPSGMFSTSGMDLSEPTLEMETVGAWLLCMQVGR